MTELAVRDGADTTAASAAAIVPLIPNSSGRKSGAGDTSGSSASLSLSTDAATRVSALELELARTAARLDAALNDKARFEDEATALRDEVTALTSAITEAQAAARIAAAEAAAAAGDNEAAAAALSDEGGSLWILGRGGYRTELHRTRDELASALREVARLESEAARLAAAVEMMGADRGQVRGVSCFMRYSTCVACM